MAHDRHEPGRGGQGRPGAGSDRNRQAGRPASPRGGARDVGGDYGREGAMGRAPGSGGGQDRYSSGAGYGGIGYGGNGDVARDGGFAGRGPKGYRRSDERIQEEVCERLTRHPGIDASDVEVRVQGGEVTLSGTVDSRRTKRMVEDVVDQCGGVVDVVNQLRIGGSHATAMDDREAREVAQPSGESVEPAKKRAAPAGSARGGTARGGNARGGRAR